MGVYYNASIAWGLRIPQNEDTRGQDLEDVYEIPAGFMYSTGGDHMSDKNIAYLIHPQGATRVVLETIGYRESGFGIHSVDEVHIPTIDEEVTLREFAERYDLEPKIGWFAVSSVG